MSNNRAHSPAASRPRSTRPVVLGSWAAVALVAAFIFWMSAHTGSQLDHGTGIVSLIKDWLSTTAAQLADHPVDVSPVGHFTEFLVFGMVLANALRFHLPLGKAAMAAAALASAFGVTDELHQIFVPTRSCDPMDWLVDTVAAIIGACIVHAILTRHIVSHV